MHKMKIEPENMKNQITVCDQSLSFKCINFALKVVQYLKEPEK